MVINRPCLTLSSAFATRVVLDCVLSAFLERAALCYSVIAQSVSRLSLDYNLLIIYSTFDIEVYFITGCYFIHAMIIMF